ncbi:MAG: HAMP domain-containing protein [Ignavibacteriales bacterium]|nr:MAG: HAMP domain-containing protein [Ignavibacteriales bacterium]
MKTLKNKINIGVIFLFCVVLLVSILSIVFINQLAQKTKGTIVDNYASVDYMLDMLTNLSDMHTLQVESLVGKKDASKNEIKVYTDFKNAFEMNLQDETNNITEKGEGDLVDELHSMYNDYLKYYDTLTLNNESGIELEVLYEKYLTLRSKILGLYKLNMNAIVNKTGELQKTADEVILYMSIVVTLSILITLSFIYNFPSKIIEPIKTLTDRIKAISERNYDQKLELNSNDELGELAAAFNIMAERLKVYESKHIDQLLFEQKRMNSLVENLEDGVLLIDENSKIVIANKTLLEITGLKRNEILLHYIAEVADSNDLIREIYNTSKVLNENSQSEIKPIRIIKNNKEVFYKIEAEDIISFSEYSQQETFIGNLILLRDITHYQERDKAKTNLLATVSHELKTPLASINLSLKMLEDKRIGQLNSDQQELLDALRQQSNRLSRVINELLDYSQIETGNIKLKFNSVRPEDIVELGVTALVLQVADKSIDMEINIDENLPSINADVEKTVFVFVNLLNNAIRYSKQNDKIVLSATKVNNEIRFSVIDNGPGISKQDQEKLFQRFSQIGNKTKQGWGLGLAISKEFIQAQGGSIWVESETGKGSTFYFSLPVKA